MTKKTSLTPKFFDLMIENHWDETANNPYETDMDDLDDIDIRSSVEKYITKYTALRETETCPRDKEIRREYCMQSAAFLLSLYSRHGINVEYYAWAFAEDMSIYSADVIRSVITKSRTTYKSAPSLSSLKDDAICINNKLRKTAEYYRALLRQREKEQAQEQIHSEQIAIKANESQTEHHWVKEDIIIVYRKIAGSALGAKRDMPRVKLGIEAMDAISEGDRFISMRAKYIIDCDAEWMASEETTIESNTTPPWVIFHQKVDPIIKEIECYLRDEL